jgi:hypothetical protein
MYRTYWYKSGINATMRNHLAQIATTIASAAAIGKDDTVIDIGCNDGTFLSSLPASKKIGVDPSNIKPSNCIHINDYFTYDNVKPHLYGKKAKAITSIAMFYDLNDPVSFVRNIRESLTDDGIWFLELSYLPRMIENAAYDSICHEHVAYYSLTTFLNVIESSDMKVSSIAFNDMNGGSFRMILTPTLKDHCDSALAIVEKEAADGYSGPEVYRKFVDDVTVSRNDLLGFLSSNSGKKIYGYGASTKGQIILQYCGIDSRHLVAIADRNPDKYGLFTPGSDIRICRETEMREAKPDFLLMFPWYFFDEFNDRERDLHDAGCGFVLPLPKFSIR